MVKYAYLRILMTKAVEKYCSQNVVKMPKSNAVPEAYLGICQISIIEFFLEKKHRVFICRINEKLR